MPSQDCTLEEACAKLYSAFFDQFPNDDLRDRVSIALALLLKRKTEFPGAPGGWAGGIAYAVGSLSCGVQGVLNADMEKAFGASMNTIRKHVHEVREVLGDDLPVNLEPLKEFLLKEMEFTIRDEANAICCYAIRTGPLETIHSSTRITEDEARILMAGASPSAAKLIDDVLHTSKITQAEMKAMMIDASSRLAKLLTMKRDKPDDYERFIRDYNRTWCGKWER